jgi:hypothetical protein
MMRARGPDVKPFVTRYGNSCRLKCLRAPAADGGDGTEERSDTEDVDKGKDAKEFAPLCVPIRSLSALRVSAGRFGSGGYSWPCCTTDSSEVSTSATLPSIRRGMALS